MNKEKGTKRIIQYIIVFVGLFLGYLILRGSQWQSSLHFHTILEVIATFLAAFVGTIALMNAYDKFLFFIFSLYKLEGECYE